MHPETQTVLSGFLAAGLAIGGILVYFILSILRQHRRYKKLAQAKISAEISTMENERRRIASDLHDEVGPMLSAIRIQVNHLKHAGADQQEIIDKSSRYIDSTIKKMREISNGLLPNILVRKGLEYALQDLCHRSQEDSGLEIAFQSKCIKRPPAEVEVNIYRIAQEIIHNTIKHAKATQLRMQLIIEENILRFATEDNGVGFNFTDKAGQSTGLGLLNLQSRTDVMKGEMSFQSDKTRGTRYLFEIPLPVTT